MLNDPNSVYDLFAFQYITIVTQFWNANH